MSLSLGESSVALAFDPTSSSNAGEEDPLEWFVAPAAPPGPVPLLLCGRVSPVPLCATAAVLVDESTSLACIALAAATRCFFAGGGDNPPLSESDDEARIATSRTL